MIQRLVAALALTLGLAACDPVVVAPADPLPPQKGGGPVAVTPALAGPQPDRSQGRAFVAVVDRLEPVAERVCRQQAPRLNCDFRIVIDDTPGAPPNAFQTVDRTGRPVIVFTPALIALTRNPDEIAFVMAHEAAHHIEDHLSQQQRNATLGAIVFGQLAGATGAGQDGIRDAQQLGAAVGLRSYSQEFELEADRLGTIITARAGYDPLVGADFFFRLPDPASRFLSTHPPNAERYAAVRRVAAELGY
ncbi:MAG: Peptidase family M48 [Rhodobacteraceae bacterium HLUCCA08]|nr:MAG: Peptidase family M48 [Rhodobacteraceae bacterium HLUCCA08]